MARPSRHSLGLNEYGEQRQPLTDARFEVLKDREVNVEQRARILRAFEAICDTLLRRGRYAKVTIQYIVDDGMIQATSVVQVVEERLPQ